MKPFPEYRDWIQRPGDSSMNITSGAYAAQREAYYRDAGALIPTEKQVGGFDANPHPSVQVWSRGELFPAVLVRTERYTSYEEFMAGRPGDIVTTAAQFYNQPLADRLESSWYTVILEGEVVEGYASYDEAKEGALGLLAVRYAFQRDAERQRAARSVA